MSKPRALITDFKEVQSSLQVFPRSPIQISDSTAWQGIFLAHHRQPAWEMPESHSSQSILSINIGATRKLERVIEGRLQRQRFLPGHATIFPAEVDYVSRWEQESEFLLLGIEPTLLARTAIEVLEQEITELIPLLSIPDPLIHSLALTLKAELESPQVGGKLYVETIAQTLSVHLLRNYTGAQTTSAPISPGLPRHKLQQATDYINDSLNQDLSLSDLAALVQLSPFYFARLFRESTGLAPHQFVIRCRVERAKELLLQGKLGISDIAVEVGFADQSHLTRHFKRIVGATPRAVLDDRKNVPNSART